MVKHFRFLYDLQTLIPDSEKEAIFADARPGTLLQMLHSHLHEDPEAQYDMYEKFIERSKVSLCYRVVASHMMIMKNENRVCIIIPQK